MADKTYQLRRGDRWTGPPLTFLKTGQDFSAGGGTVVRCQLRDSPDGQVRYEFALTSTYPAVGQMQTQLIVPGDITVNWPVRKLVGDVEVSRVSPVFGPYTVFTFELVVLSDVTR